VKLDHVTDTSQSSRETIQRSHQLNGESAQLRAYYQQWADSYDDDVRAEDYRGPQVMAELLEQWRRARPAETAVLDAGCGTGLVGAELRRRGYPLIDGCDLSDEMVDLARQTHAYRQLHPGVDLNWDLGTVGAGRYDAVICCGVFTLGHVLPAALNQLLKAVRPGGLVLVSTRDHYLKTSGFRQHLSWLRREGRADLRHARHDAPYIADESASYWVLQLPTG
jgi:predicted TPR repeat methyltransferase